MALISVGGNMFKKKTREPIKFAPETVEVDGKPYFKQKDVSDGECVLLLWRGVILGHYSPEHA